VAATGYTFSNWTGDVASPPNAANPIPVTMDANKVVTANYTINTYALTVSTGGTGAGTVTSTPAGINCGSTCLFSFNYGSAVTLNQTPGTHSGFAGWGGACSGTGACSVTMDAIKSVTATFNILPTFILTTAVNPAGGGTITPAAGTHSYYQGDSITITASANLGYNFANWSGACTGSGACVVSMVSDKAVTAVFSVTGTSKLGDVNGDGKVNATDALIVLSGSAGLNVVTYCPLLCGDTNGDGRVNATDALIILSYSAGMSVPYEVGKPGCPAVVTPCPGCLVGQ
jgi:hypothetical protein